MGSFPFRVCSQYKTNTTDKLKRPNLDFFGKWRSSLRSSLEKEHGERRWSLVLWWQSSAALDKIKYKYRNSSYKLLNEISNLGLRHTKLLSNFLLKEIFLSSGTSKWRYLLLSQTNLSQHFQLCLAQRLDSPGNFYNRSQARVVRLLLVRFMESHYWLVLLIDSD